jgi:hypothetical protein
MASAFAADLPIVGALLHTKARLEIAKRELRPSEAKAQEAYVQSLTKREAGLPFARLGLGSRSGKTTREPTDDVGRAIERLRKATADLGPSAVSSWDRYGGAVSVLMVDDPPEPLRAVDNMAVQTVLQAGTQAAVGVSRALDAVVSNPQFAAMTPSELAETLEVMPDTARAVWSSVQRWGGGVVLLNPVVARPLEWLRPPPSNAAIALAAGTIRPETQGLADPLEAAATFSALRYEGPYDAPGAQVDRARRAVARRTWVEWYKAAEKAGQLGKVR